MLSVTDETELRLLRRILRAERAIQELRRRVAELEEHKYRVPEIPVGPVPPVVFKDPE